MLLQIPNVARCWLVLAAVVTGLSCSADALWAQRPKPTGPPKPAGAKTSPTKSSPTKTKQPAKDAPDLDDEEDFPYKMLPTNPDLEEKGKDKKAAAAARANRSALDMKVAAVLGNREPIADEETRKEIDRYYQRYVFARLTHPEGITDWPEARKRFQRLISPNTVPAEAHDYFVSLAFQVMSVIAKGDYHPAARYNAALFIADLNNQEAVVAGEAERRHVEVPYIDGLKFMLDELANPQQIDAVHVACLVGIRRHVKIDGQLISENRRLVSKSADVKNNAETRIVDAMLALISKKEPPEGRSRGGHEWMRRRAVEILGHLSPVGDNGRVLAKLDELVGDNTEPVPLRCSTAEALGRLNYPAKVNLNLAQTGKKLAALAAYAVEMEIRRVEGEQARGKKTREATLAAAGQMMPSGEGVGAFGPPRKDPMADFLSYRIDLTRRRVKDQLNYVKRGLVGPKLNQKGDQKAGLQLLAKGEDAKYIQKVIDEIDGILSVVDSQSSELLTLLTQLQKSVRELEEQCGVTVELPEAGKTSGAEEKTPVNPLDALGLEATGEKKPEAQPAGKPPAAKPAAAPANTKPADAKQPPAATPPAEKAPAAPPGPTLAPGDAKP
ncbi:MAG: hypothetical protein NTY19_25885 [Planctomycetota bacterium]|nr:hypothetical protein [Planctomycetota bacterium]